MENVVNISEKKDKKEISKENNKTMNSLEKEIDYNKKLKKRKEQERLQDNKKVLKSLKIKTKG